MVWRRRLLCKKCTTTNAVHLKATKTTATTAIDEPVSRRLEEEDFINKKSNNVELRRRGRRGEGRGRENEYDDLSTVTTLSSSSLSTVQRDLSPVKEEKREEGDREEEDYLKRKIYQQQQQQNEKTVVDMNEEEEEEEEEEVFTSNNNNNNAILSHSMKTTVISNKTPQQQQQSMFYTDLLEKNHSMETLDTCDNITLDTLMSDNITEYTADDNNNTHFEAIWSMEQSNRNVKE